MVTLLSAQHARNNIRLHWKHAGFEPLPELLSESVAEELGTSPLETELGALYVFVDEYLGLLRYCTYYFLSGVPPSGQAAMLFHRLAVKQIRNLSAVRVLCAAGLDGNARMQLRLLYETSLVWQRVLVDPAFRAEFQTATTAEAANKFWHKYISKEKNEKWLKEYFDARAISWLGADNEIVGEMKQKMSLSTHPTFLQAFVDAREDWIEPKDGLVLGTPSVSSHFTLSMAIFATAIPFSVIPEPDYGITTVDMLARGPWHPVHTSKPTWERYNTELRAMIPRLLLAAVRFSELLPKGNQPTHGPDAAGTT
ncbi:hypothetical protein [Acidovorax sp. BL-A-41-H1]|uniref:hypothetical protein n=1 Tax=Acidovorax sp. BL-A-41-H1 TaxID=3421102 RepID=UPI003F7A4EB6